MIMMLATDTETAHTTDQDGGETLIMVLDGTIAAITPQACTTELTQAHYMEEITIAQER